VDIHDGRPSMPGSRGFWRRKCCPEAKFRDVRVPSRIGAATVRERDDVSGGACNESVSAGCVGVAFATWTVIPLPHGRGTNGSLCPPWICTLCQHRGWVLYALAVRTEHVHVVLGAEVGVRPERVLTLLKSWATRRMVESGTLSAGTRAWSRHGSTRHLWTHEAIASASRYVIDGQGRALSEGSGQTLDR
jgi:hypothetical protein